MAGLKIRFDIFKRDNFTCQYCGRKTPEIILELDHIVPRSKGGLDELHNLITSCYECNRGKGAEPLSKIKTRKDLKGDLYLLAEKELQLKEYYKLREKVEKRIRKEVSEIASYFFSKEDTAFAFPYERDIKQFLKIFTKYDIMEAIDIARAKLPRGDDRNRYRYMCGVLHTKRRAKDEIIPDR